MKKITVYTTNTCAYCGMLKKFLTYKNINFSTVNLSDEPDRRDEVRSMSGYDIVPQTLVEEDGQLPKIVVGYNISELSQAIA